MKEKIGRFIGAIILAFLATIVINSVTLLLFGGIAHIIQIIQDITFWGFMMYIVIIGIGGSLVMGIAQAIGYGFLYVSRGSKFIAIVVTLILLNGFLNDIVILIAEHHHFHYAGQAIDMIKSEAGSFYNIGAIITLIVEFLWYLIYSILCFDKPKDY